jgi:hypothetical protein
MPARETILDPRLALDQRGVEVIFVDTVNAKLAGLRRLAQRANGLQLGGRRDHALADHRQAQIALARGLAVQQPRELQPARHHKRRLHVTGPQRALDVKRRVDLDVLVARERTADQLDRSSGRCERLAGVSFLTLPPSRKERRSNVELYSRSPLRTMFVTTCIAPECGGLLAITASYRTGRTERRDYTQQPQKATSPTATQDRGPPATPNTGNFGLARAPGRASGLP